MPGSSYHPLEIESEDGFSELELFRKAAHDSPPRDELIALVGVDTGLRAAAIAHLTENWLDKTGENLVIDVPQYSRCRLGVDNDGVGGDTTKRDAPCSDCERRTVDQDWLLGTHRLPDGGDCWRPKSEAGYKGREIPVLEPDTERIIETYFRVHDKVIGQDAVRSAVTRVADRAGIHETETDANGITHHWPTTHDLRNTFGTRLAVKGFSAREIKSIMGHSSIEQADDYIELSGVKTRNAFKENWNNDGG